MPTTYETAKGLVSAVKGASEAYQGIDYIGKAREAAATFALDEGDQVAANAYRDPSTPLENVANAIGVARQEKAQRLEALVDDDFSGILAGVDKKKLPALLAAYQPMKEGNGVYEGHIASTLLQSYEATKERDPETAEAIAAEMIKEIQAHYKKKYEVKDGDSEEVAKMKKMKMNLFMSLYVTSDGKAFEGDGRLASKYLSLKSDAIKAFREATSDEDSLRNYIVRTAPEDKAKRVEMVSRMLAA